MMVSIDTLTGVSIVQPIPLEWRTAVMAALRSGDENRIISKNTADNEWGAAFPNSFSFERHEAMATALAVDGITGRHIADMDPRFGACRSCDAYEFWFTFEKRLILGKIGLLPTGDIIIIFSSHIPRKGDTL